MVDPITYYILNSQPVHKLQCVIQVYKSGPVKESVKLLKLVLSPERSGSYEMYSSEHFLSITHDSKQHLNTALKFCM